MNDLRSPAPVKPREPRIAEGGGEFFGHSLSGIFFFWGGPLPYDTVFWGVM